MYDKDPKGIGVGIYRHIEQDCHRFFKEWSYNFLKVDWCGGEKMNLDDIVFNVCRWKFPGVWAIKKANSSRISGDIEARFASILKIIDLNSELYQYSSRGHYNDMDMLQVG